MNSPKVLLVDDDADQNEINRIALERAGFTVYMAENSAAARRVLAENQINVAVLDVMMDTPTEGFALAREIRQDARTKNVPLLMLTAVNAKNEEIGSFVRFSDRERDKDWLPVDRFADKPIKAEELVTLVRTLTGSWTFSR
jgi:DNA-binding response OmpR family regulator